MVCLRQFEQHLILYVYIYIYTYIYIYKYGWRPWRCYSYSLGLIFAIVVVRFHNFAQVEATLSLN